VTFAKFLFIYYGEKMMDKANIKETREAMWKEKEQIKTSRITKCLIMEEQVVKCAIERHVRAPFVATWSTTTFKEARIHLHQSFQASYKSQKSMYKSFNQQC
jgi:hypothetical protein